MVRKLQLLAMSFHDEAHAGAIANKILNSVDAIESTIRMFATQMATILVYCIAAIVVTLLKCPLMSLFYAQTEEETSVHRFSYSLILLLARAKTSSPVNLAGLFFAT